MRRTLLALSLLPVLSQAADVTVSLYGVPVPSSYLTIGTDITENLSAKAVSVMYDYKEYSGFAIDYSVFKYSGVDFRLDLGYLNSEYYSAYTVKYGDLSCTLLDNNVFFNYSWEL